MSERPELDYRGLFDATPTPYLVLAPDLTVVEVNQAYLAATGTDRQAVLGRPIAEVGPAGFDPDGVRDLVRSLRRVLDTGQPDQASTPVSDASGAVTHVIHRVEGLRSSLAALHAVSELLALDGPSGHPSLAALERQVGAIVRTTGDLLDTAKALTGRLELACAPLDLCSVVATAVEDIRPEFAQAGRHLRISLPDGPVPVDGDRVRLSQLLANLLSNGRKYTRPGGNVTVQLRRRAGSAVVTVTDDGVGFDPASTERLFEVRVRPQYPAVGLGLGLSLVRSIAELHHGSVHADSDGPGTGARFSVRIPLTAPPVDSPGPDRTLAIPTPRAALRILIVEDNLDLAAAYQALLGRYGDSVTVAHTGRDGLVAALHRRFDLILSDLGLPDISGYQLARELRRMLAPGRTRLIAMSDFSQDADRSTRAGFDAHLIKPVTIVAVDRLLMRWAAVRATDRSEPARTSENG